jgi:hypothetical protein
LVGSLDDGIPKDRKVLRERSKGLLLRSAERKDREWLGFIAPATRKARNLDLQGLMETKKAAMASNLFKDEGADVLF